MGQDRHALRQETPYYDSYGGFTTMFLTLINNYKLISRLPLGGIHITSRRGIRWIRRPGIRRFHLTIPSGASASLGMHL